MLLISLGCAKFYRELEPYLRSTVYKKGKKIITNIDMIDMITGVIYFLSILNLFLIHIIIEIINIVNVDKTINNDENSYMVDKYL